MVCQTSCLAAILGIPFNIHKTPRSTARSLETGSYIFGYKESRCCKNGLTLVGRDHLAAAQANRASVHLWTWHKVCGGIYTYSCLLMIGHQQCYGHKCHIHVGRLSDHAKAILQHVSLASLVAGAVIASQIL